MIKFVFGFIRSLAILYGMLYLGESLGKILPITIPASILGLLILFCCLVLKIVKVKWLLPCANLLIGYMAFLFVPVSVGVIQYTDLLVTQAKSILVPNIISTCVMLLLSGWLGNYFFSRHSFSYLRKKILKNKAKV